MVGKNNSSKEKMSKKKKIIIVASILAGVLVIFGAMLIVGYFGFGNGMKSGEEAETENTNSEAYGESASREEEVCWIAETEKEKALAMQEYTSNALLEVASAETEEETDINSEAASRGDGGLAGDDTEEASTEEDTSSKSSNSSNSSGSSSNKSNSSGSSSSGSSKSSNSGSTTKHAHSYTSTVTKQPTCSSTGVRTYTCSCGDSYTEEIAATGHTWVEYTYTEEVDAGAVYEEKFVCTTCNAWFDTADKASDHLTETHHFGYANNNVKVSDHDYVIVTNTGYKCSVCGATK